MRARDTFEFHTISEGRKAQYLSNETATYTGSGEEVEGNNTEDKGKQTRTELHISSRLIERQHKEESQIG